MEAFSQFLAETFEGRNEAILAALRRPPRGVVRRVFSEAPPAPDPWWYDCGQEGEGYQMDPASVVVARSLGVEPGHTVLDMCAAPGGKALVLLEALEGQGKLTLNELSTARRMKMKQILREYLPESAWALMRIEGRDAIGWGVKRPEAFDRVLLDAPCSGERHLIQNEKIHEWTPKRARNLARKQFGLLASAALAVKVGGNVVYSTCSLNPIENDGVVGRLLKRRPELRRVDPPWTLPQDFEKTEHGWIALPDKTGFGPMYFSRLVRDNLPSHDHT